MNLETEDFVQEIGKRREKSGFFSAGTGTLG